MACSSCGSRTPINRALPKSPTWPCWRIFVGWGSTWDEGPEIGGPHAPYRQSERTDRYAMATDQLLERGSAYLCYCTPEELAERRKAAQAARRAPGYDGRCRDLTDDQRAKFETRRPCILGSVPRAGGPDGHRRRRRAWARSRPETAQIPDFVIRRSDGSPTYMLAVTVDDVEMDITHIVRGEDLMAATPRQLLMREAIGRRGDPRLRVTCRCSSTRKAGRLSKRWGDVSVAAYREQGFLPEALVNYLALLGWSYDDHTNIFSMDELVEKFSLERVGKNPAAFDVNKLEWLNGHYIREKTPEEMAELLVKVCAKARLNVDSEASRDEAAGRRPSDHRTHEAADRGPADDPVPLRGRRSRCQDGQGLGGPGGVPSRGGPAVSKASRSGARRRSKRRCDLSPRSGS